MRTGHIINLQNPDQLGLEAWCALSYYQVTTEFLLQGVAWLPADEELTIALLSRSSVWMLRGQATRNLPLLRSSERNILVKKVP